MEWREQRGKHPPNAPTERHSSALTPTRANRCKRFNEACASDLAPLSRGKIFFQKKHHIVWAIPSPRDAWHLHALKLACPVVCGNHATRTGGPDSLCQSNTMSIRFMFQKLEPAKQCFFPPRRMKEVRHCHSQIRGHLGKTEQCRNQRNIKAEKKEYTSIPLSELATHTQSKDNSYTMWVTQSPYYF